MIVDTEMVVFEWLREAGTTVFRALSRLVSEGPGPREPLVLLPGLLCDRRLFARNSRHLPREREVLIP